MAKAKTAKQIALKFRQLRKQITKLERAKKKAAKRRPKKKANRRKARRKKRR